MAAGTSIRERWEGISPREQGLIVLLGLTAVFIAFWYMGTSISKGLDEIEARNKKTRLALSALQAYRLSGDESNANQVAIGDEPVKLNTYLEGIANNVGISIPEFNPVSPSTRNGYNETATRIELRNVSIANLGQFLEQVERESNVVVVQSLEIKRQLRNKEQLNVAMVVATYSNAKSADDGDGAEE